MNRLIVLALVLLVPPIHAEERLEILPDRDLPPSLSDIGTMADRSPELRNEGISSNEKSTLTSRLSEYKFQLEKSRQQNMDLKFKLQEMQLERAHLLLRGEREEANALRSSIWENRTIEVHWENPDAAPEEERNWVRDAVKRTWEANSGLRFIGWDKATATSRGIRIKIAEEGPHCKRLGKFLDGMRDGMVLNFTFGAWCPTCAIDRKGSIEKIAVHEFGHAIGFAHEQNRTDAPEWCQRERQGTDGDWYITLYDPDSIMNYCNPRWNNDGLLSPKDIQAAQILYGRSESAPAPTPAP